MKFFFPETDSGKVIKDLEENLSKRAINKIVSFEDTNGSVTVTIRKLGKSMLWFSKSEVDDGQQWSLEKEKIAFAHRTFKTEVIEKLSDIVKEVGGTVL